MTQEEMNLKTEYVYVTESFDWSDEFDVYGCYVTTRENLNKWLDTVKKGFEEGNITQDDEFYFGTNEGISFSDYDDLTNGISVNTCTKEFYDEFVKLNHGKYFGHTFLTDVVEHVRYNKED